jgi:DnaJ like chaperone protein
MTLSEGAVIVLGLVAGYWAVSKFLFRPSATQQKPPAEPSAGSPAANRPADCYQVLQVPPTASIAEIRASYKLLISKYHPDKVDSLGQDLKDLAERKTQEITLAYREAMRARGETP